MLRALSLVVLTVAVGGLAAGCGDDDSSGGAAAPTPTTTPPGTVTSKPGGGELDGKTFTSTKVVGQELAPGTKIVLSFENGRLAAQAGCNTMAAAYKFENGGELVQEPAATTMMGCPDGLAEQDQWVGELLTGGAKATLAGDVLTLTSGATTVTLEAGASAGGPPPVVGTLWTLVSTMPRTGTAASVPAGVDPPTLQIEAKTGRAAIFTGCNQGGAEAKFAEGFITFGPVMTTKMACEPAAQELESTVLSILDGKAAVGFSENNLVVAKDGNSLTYSAK